MASPTVADPKLSKLRDLLAVADAGRQVDALIIPSEDPHMVSFEFTLQVVVYCCLFAAVSFRYELLMITFGIISE